MPRPRTTLYLYIFAIFLSFLTLNLYLGVVKRGKIYRAIGDSNALVGWVDGLKGVGSTDRWDMSQLSR
jgi:hypothetical protein